MSIFNLILIEKRTRVSNLTDTSKALEFLQPASRLADVLRIFVGTIHSVIQP